MSGAVQFADIDWAGRPVSIEYQWVGVDNPTTPLLVFLHEGLGSRSMWRAFPATLCETLGCRGLVYSRPAYGQSTPRAADEHWQPDFMHRQAYEVLPAFLQAVGVEGGQQPLWLFGHSDGASIALLYAARFPQQLAGAIVLAPHIKVEDITIQSIEQAREVYRSTDLPAKLGRYHQDPDSAFWGWNDIWLHPDFRTWSIEAELAHIQCPLLAIQGLDDEYGTLAQIHGIATCAPQTQLIELNNCGHSPHRDQAEELIRVTADFIHQH